MTAHWNKAILSIHQELSSYQGMNPLQGSSFSLSEFVRVGFVKYLGTYPKLSPTCIHVSESVEDPDSCFLWQLEHYLPCG